MSYTNITSLLKSISEKLAKFERTHAILVECIKSQQYLNVSQKTPELMVLFDFQHVWLASGHFLCAVKKIDTLDGVYCTVVWCSKLKPRCPDLALSLDVFPMSVNISFLINVVRWVFKKWPLYMPPFLSISHLLPYRIDISLGVSC